MQPLFNRPIALTLAIVLFIYLLMRGVVPAWTAVDSDFPNYLTAAKIVVEGGDVEKLYDDAWFNAQIASHGMTSQGKFAPFPPPTALLLVPLAGLDPLSALRFMTIVSVLCLIIAIVLLAKLLEWPLADAAVFVLLAGIAVTNGLRLGQAYIVVSMFLVLGYFAYVRDRPIWAGVCLGLFLPIKYYSATAVLYLALARRWKSVLACVVTAVAVVMLSVSLLGVDIHVTFLRSILGAHLSAHLSQQDPFAISFQSFDTLFRRLFVYDATLNPAPFINAPQTAIVANAVVKAVLVIVTAVAFRRLKAATKEWPSDLSIGLIGVTALLIAPATAGYHFVLLWLPVGLLLRFYVRNAASAHAYATLAAYAAIGFFPYSIPYRFADQGALAVLAYPRLWLLLAMLLLALRFIWTLRPSVAMQPVTHRK